MRNSIILIGLILMLLFSSGCIEETGSQVQPETQAPTPSAPVPLKPRPTFRPGETPSPTTQTPLITTSPAPTATAAPTTTTAPITTDSPITTPEPTIPTTTPEPTTPPTTPTTTSEPTTTIHRVVDLQDRSQVQLVISNEEGRDITYKICTTVENSTECFMQPIREGKRFTYRRNFYFEENEGKEVIVTIYREGEPEPIEKAFWHIKP